MTPAEFETLTVGMPYVPRGMFFSELYLFVRSCLLAGVVQVIESGVRNGLSTRVLRAVWPGRVQSVDLKPSRCPADLRDQIITGDGRAVLPMLLTTQAHELPIGILLDGPKGPKGDALRAVCFAVPSVRVVGQHDSLAGRGESIHSWDATFQRESGDALDARIPAEIRGRYLFGCPGLGIWVRA